MNMKKIAVVAVLALVVIGFVVVAGCTSANDDPIVGTWTYSNGSIKYSNDFYSNHTGIAETYYNGDLMRTVEFKWSKNSDSAYVATSNTPSDYGTNTVKITMNSAKTQLTMEGNTFTKKSTTITPASSTSTDPIIGKWKHVENNNGQVNTAIMTYSKNGTGTSSVTFNGQTQEIPFTWAQVSPNKYSITFEGSTTQYSTITFSGNSMTVAESGKIFAKI